MLSIRRSFVLSAVALSFLFNLSSIHAEEREMERGFRWDDLQMIDRDQGVVTEHHYFLVTGFLNEFAGPLYYLDQIRALKKLGVPKDQIHVIRPFSGESIDRNSNIMWNEMERKSRHKPDLKWVWVGHSKGAAEILAMAVKRPSLFMKKVHLAFCIQGAIGGSPIADFFLGKAKPFSKDMPLKYRGGVFLTGSFLGIPLNTIFRKGLRHLGSDLSKANWKRWLSKKPERVEDVSTRVRYIRTHQNPSENIEFLKSLGWYLKTSYGPSDGLVEYEDQSLDGVGELFLRSQGADHVDLVVAGLSPEKVDLRYQLAYSIAKEVANVAPLE